MVFSSITFLFFFLPITLLLYALSGWSLVVRNLILLITSLLFYTWGGGEYVFILLASILINWVLGLFANRARNQGNKRLLRFTVFGSVAVNLAILGYFKYTNFFIDQINGVTAQIPNLYLSIQWPEVILPIGISFYTFQSMSYVIDVAQGSARVMRNPANFALYVSMFPQLIAGPIVRYHEISEQLEKRKSTFEDVSLGILRFAHGLVKKVLVADSVAILADQAFGASNGSLHTLDAWVGIIAYTIQIYFDFSGYSDMAIGLGRIFGFRFPENFRHPYSSVSITDFWRRWHITLSHWFRDYVYIPLGGSRTAPVKRYRNLIVVFFLTGLWHGANWTFIVWGIYHGFWLIVERLTHTRRVISDQNDVDPNRAGWRLNFTALGQRAMTLILIMLGWVLFRAQDLTQAKLYYQTLFSVPSQGLSEFFLNAVNGQSLLALLFGCCIIFFPRSTNTGEIIENSSSQWATSLRLLIAFVTFPLALIIVISGSFSPFLYFQF